MSGFSIARGESSATSAPDAVAPSTSKTVKKQRRRSNRRRILDKGLHRPSPKQNRYWNEFDDGSEGSENEAYTILVDPNASSSFPGVATFSKFSASIGSTFYSTAQKVAFWRRPSPGSRNRQSEPLLNGNHTPSVEDSDPSDEETSPGLLKPPARRHYSTFPIHHQSPAIRARETLLFRSCLTSFGASFVLLLVAVILETSGRRKAEATVDAGVIIGVAASLVFAIMAVGSMMGRKDTLGWIHRAVVLLVFACVVVCSGALLAALG